MNTVIEVWDDWYTSELVENNPDFLFVFGDNLVHKGHGGQAVIRDYSNTYGIPTKREPNKRPTSYFSDKESEANHVKSAIDNLCQIRDEGKYKKIIFPKAGIGTGLSHTKLHSPRIYDMMKMSLKNNFGYEWEDTE